MRTRLRYSGVVNLLHGWLGRRVAVTVSQAGVGRHTVELGGTLNRGEGPAAGLGELPDGAEVIYFSVGAETGEEYCWFALDEAQFVEAWLTRPEGVPVPPSLRVRSGGLDLAVSPVAAAPEPT